MPGKTLQQILDEAQTLPPHERLRFIREACATDSDLYANAMHELESLGPSCITSGKPTRENDSGDGHFCAPFPVPGSRCSDSRFAMPDSR